MDNSSTLTGECSVLIPMKCHDNNCLTLGLIREKFLFSRDHL